MESSLTKKAILAGYAHSLSIETFAKNRLILVTAAGIISGIPVLDEEKSDLNVISLQTFNSAAVEALSEYGSSKEDFILLKDAHFEATSARIDLPALTVFCDQVIAATIGSY